MSASHHLQHRETPRFPSSRTPALTTLTDPEGLYVYHEENDFSSVRTSRRQVQGQTTFVTKRSHTEEHRTRGQGNAVRRAVRGTRVLLGTQKVLECKGFEDTVRALRSRTAVSAMSTERRPQPRAGGATISPQHVQPDRTRASPHHGTGCDCRGTLQEGTSEANTFWRKPPNHERSSPVSSGLIH